MRMIVVDANSIFYRSYHGIPEMNRANGQPTNAIYGLTRQLLKVRREFEHFVPIVVWDHPGNSFREHIWRGYKADRRRPDLLTAQSKGARELVTALGFPVIEQAGFEADDTIAHLVEMGRENSCPWTVEVIMTGDKDMLQLVSDRTRVFDPWADVYKGVSDCFKKFGVTPDKVPLVQALMGDSVDGFPGVQGIGPKKAADLVNEYGSIDAILRAASNTPKGVMWANIRTTGNDLHTFEQLAKLSTNTPLTVQGVLDLIDRTVYNEDTARVALEHFEFRSLL